MINKIYHILLIFLLSTNLMAENSAPVTRDECHVKSENPKGVLVLLIDQSQSTELGENFEQTLRVAKGSSNPGTRVIVATIGDRRSSSKVLIDITRPVETLWEPKIAFMKKDKRFKDCISQVATFARALGADPGGTAILETLMFVDEIFRNTKAESQSIILYSDMIQNSDTFSFYKVTKKDTPQTILARAEAEHLMPNFKNVTVKIAGVGGAQSDKQSRFAEDFWRGYFGKAEAKLDFYGPTLIN